MRRLKTIFYWLVGFYAVLVLLLYLFQEKILFHPEVLPKDFVFEFDHVFEEIYLPSEDGAELHGIHFKNQDPKGVILYFHGNSGSLRRWGELTTFFVEKNYDVVIMDYRGYGKSTGTLTEQRLYDDAQLFYEYVLKQFSENEIIVYGRSLGTGIAIKVAADNEPEQLVLETPYYSIQEIAETKFPFIPTANILKYRIPSHEMIQDVRCAITIYHGTNDQVVPFTSGKRLFESIPNKNKKFIVVPGGSHNNLILYQEYLSTIDSALGN